MISFIGKLRSDAAATRISEASASPLKVINARPRASILRIPGMWFTSVVQSGREPFGFGDHHFSRFNDYSHHFVSTSACDDGFDQILPHALARRASKRDFSNFTLHLIPCTYCNGLFLPPEEVR